MDKKEEEIKDLKVERLKDKKQNYDTSYIITLLGDAKVGKTCFLKRAYEGTFSDEYTQTYFKRFMIRAKINDKEIVLLSFYDKCGDDMEIYKEGLLYSRENFCKSSNLCILMYDISSKESFKSINKWFEYCKDLAVLNPKYLLVGNKSDLKDKRQVSIEQGKKLAEEKGMEFFETSAKDGTNIENVITKVAKIVYKDYNGQKGETLEPDTQAHKVNIKLLKYGKNKKENWCITTICNIFSCFNCCCNK